MIQNLRKKRYALVAEKGLSVKKVAEDLGIHSTMLGNWKRQYLRDGSFPGKGHVRPENKEFLRLKKSMMT